MSNEDRDDGEARRVPDEAIGTSPQAERYRDTHGLDPASPRDRREPDPQLVGTAVEITHPQGFGGHEFEYDSTKDLFVCVFCGGYEIVLRDRETGEIPPCESAPAEAGQPGPAEAPTGPSMDDLYPGGRGYHKAHEPYIGTVADALEANGFPVANWHADANDPRDGAIELDLARSGTIDGKPVWPHDEVDVCWQEERGWYLVTIDDPHGKDARWVYPLGVELVASPASVVCAVADRAGLNVEVPGDGHPDVDFPGHMFDDDNMPLELALRRYADGSDNAEPIPAAANADVNLVPDGTAQTFQPVTREDAQRRLSAVRRTRGGSEEEIAAVMIKGVLEVLSERDPMVRNCEAEKPLPAYTYNVCHRDAGHTGQHRDLYGTEWDGDRRDEP